MILFHNKFTKAGIFFGFFSAVLNIFPYKGNLIPLWYFFENDNIFITLLGSLILFFSIFLTFYILGLIFLWVDGMQGEKKRLTKVGLIMGISLAVLNFPLLGLPGYYFSFPFIYFFSAFNFDLQGFMEGFSEMDGYIVIILLGSIGLVIFVPLIFYLAGLALSKIKKQ